MKFIQVREPSPIDNKMQKLGEGIFRPPDDDRCDATHRNVTVVPSGLVDVIGYYHGEVCPLLVDTSVHTGPC